MQRIPFTVIGGFLGAGKTTLLNRWLAAAASQPQAPRIAVLVNDFGAINIDAALVQQAGSDAIALSNGCICCAIGDDLSAALQALLQASPPFDAVVVEASGVSDPWRIAQYALAEPRLQLQAVLLLVDAAALAGHLADPLLTDTLTRPLAHADLVVLNHADRASATALDAARAWVQADAAQRGQPPAPILAASHADLPLALLHDRLYQPHGGGLASTRAADHGRQFQAWQQQPAGLFDEARLRAWLRALPPGVLRLKGWLPVADHHGLSLQWAGRHASLRRLATLPAGGAALVAIGLTGQLPVDRLAAGLAACLAERAAEED
ncbi:MAG: GTP-binding protein [Aquabacterium sp.]|nr:GTP-binding protein [Aquabacterium sp.]